MERPQSSHACYDLHLHTCWSYDATAQAESYFRRARELGTRCLTITDHHVLDSLPEVVEVARAYPEIIAIPSAELTVTTSIGSVDLLCYDSQGMMIAARVVQGTELEQAIVEHFETCEVEYQHIHNASVGCFDCAVRRA